jgi:hypothetical protein
MARAAARKRRAAALCVQLFCGSIESKLDRTIGSQ